MLMTFPMAAFSQQPSASTAQVPQSTMTITRSPDSTPEDLAVPLCPTNFDDGLNINGVADSKKDSVTPLRLLHSVQAAFPVQAKLAMKKQHIKDMERLVLAHLIVDDQGQPRDVCIQRSVGFGLDASAADAIRQYRFSPATKDGQPVQIRISVEIDIRPF